MKDVARRAGVDVSTVSLAINNDPRIRRETREKIVAIAADLGYRKNHLARGLRSGKSFTIGAVVGYSAAFWGDVLAGAQSVLSEREYHLLLDYAPDDKRREEAQIEALKSKRVDGLIIAPSDSDPESGEGLPTASYRDLQSDGVPFVFVDRFAPGLDADYVAADNFAGARAACRYLLELGHTQIAYIYSPHRMNTAQRERLEGYRSVLREAKLAPMECEAPQVRTERTEEGLDAVRDLLTSPQGRTITAILAATDETALGVLRGLREANVRAPDQMSVIGFGGGALADYLDPPLTTVTLPMRALGEQAARLLFDRTMGDHGPPRHVVLPTTLTVRGSCAPPRG